MVRENIGREDFTAAALASKEGNTRRQKAREHPIGDLRKTTFKTSVRGRMSVTHIVIPVESQQVTLNKRVDHQNSIILMAFRQILQ